MSTIEPTYYYAWVTTSSQCGWVSGNSEPINTNTGTNGGTSSSGGTGGGTSSNSTNIYTGVVSLSPDQLLVKDFIISLPDDQEEWYTNQPEEFQNEVDLYLTTNNFSDESKEEIKNTIDILHDGMINGEPVLVGPNVPIDDMEEYLDCFDTSLGATITIYADQPKTGGHNVWTFSNGVGHAFITIQQGDNIASFGFYPQCSPCSLSPNNLTPNPLDFFSTPGVFGNDQGHDYNVSLSIPINSVNLTNLINGVISVAESDPM